MLRRASSSVLVLCVLLTAWSCGSPRDETGSKPGFERADSSEVSRPPTLEELSNATYAGIADAPVTLAAGLFEGKPVAPGGASRPRIGLVRELAAFGDLDGDGVGDAAVLLWESSGGSGTFIHLAAMGQRAGATVNLGTAPVGDRTQVRSMTISEGMVVMDVVEQGPEDAACCPTQLARKSWALQGDSFIPIASEVEGVLSLAILRHSTWELAEWDFGDPAPPEPRLTLAFEADRIAGLAGCNRYFGAIAESAPGVIVLGPLGSTRMACSDSLMALEARFLDRLGKANHYSFLSGRLALTWQDGDRMGTLLFAPADTTQDH